jgi:multiple sugar transport system substrate-binding protein
MQGHHAVIKGTLKAAAVVGLVCWSLLLGAGVGPVLAAKQTLTWGVIPGAQYEDRYKGIETLFEAAYPDVDLKWVPISNYTQTLVTMAVAGSAPDVFNVYVEDLASWATAGMLEPLNVYISKSKFDLSPLFPSAVSAFSYEGNLYGIPMILNISGLFYNSDMLDAASIRAPDETWTWHDLAMYGSKLTQDKNGDGAFEQFGFSRNSDLAQWVPLVHAYGGGIIDIAKKQVVFNSTATQEALQLYVDLSQKYHAAPRPGEGSGFTFENGQYGTTIMGDWVRQNYRKITTFSWDVAPMPKGPKARVAFLGGSAVAINRSTKQKDLAWKFVSFITNEGVQKVIANTRAGVPVVEKVAVEEYVGTNPVPATAINLVKMMAYAQWVPGVPRWRDMLNVIRGQFNDLIAGNLPVAEMVENTTQKLKQLL